MVVILMFIYLLCCVQNTAGDETLILHAEEGSDVTISTGITGVRSDAQIQWFYGPERVKEEILISLVFKGKSGTEIMSERFKGRVQLDRSSGDLTINNINITDSGLYTVHITAGRVTSRTFNLSVYAPVSTPEVTRQNQTSNNQTQTRTRTLGEFCFLLCSVRNGRDVNLSWYEEEKIISVTNNSDLRVSLQLSLIIKFTSSKTFFCEAANPVSNKRVSVTNTEICSNTPDHRLVPIMVSGILLLLLLLLTGAGFWVWRGKIKIKKEDNSSVTEQEDPVVCSEVIV